MSGWDDLVSTALIGTGRRAVPSTPSPELAAGASAAAVRASAAASVAASAVAADTAGAPDGAADDAAVLLDRAALLTVARRAARRPAAADPLTPAPADPHPEAGPAAAQRLARMLTGEQPDVLPEWLAAVAARQRVVPSCLLPRLLDQARTHPGLRSAVAAAGGSRARWLAALNPAWSYLLAEADPRSSGDLIQQAEAAADGLSDAETVWELGSADERRSYLTALRSQDPRGARELAESEWDTATPGERAWFIAALGTGLGRGDEPLLERALDDRRQEVRWAAAGLLARLPGSALSRRMSARAAATLRVDRRSRHDVRLVAEPPAGCDAALRRDGVTPHPPQAKPEPAAARGWWLAELLARTPLGTWTEAFGLPPSALTGLRMDAWAPWVLTGWARAAVTQHDEAWAHALLDLALAGKLPGQAPVCELLTVLPADPADPAGPRTTLAAALVRSARRPVSLADLLTGLPGPWTGELAVAVLAAIARLSRTPGGTRGPAELAVTSLCRTAALRLPPEPATLAGLNELVCPGQLPGMTSPDLFGADAPPHIHDLAATLRFRHEMLTELVV